MKYKVSKKGSNIVFKFETYKQAADFCYMYVMAEQVKGNKFPELSINKVRE